MRIRTPEVKYHCFNDCCQTGCPGHILCTELYTVSDTESIIIDGKPEYYMDHNMLNALVRSYVFKGGPIIRPES